MPELRFDDQIYTVDDYDTVLNTLLKNGHAVPNFCRSGYCHSCMMKCEEGTPLPTAQAGLSEELVDENHFLACQCAVFMPMSVAAPAKEKRTRFTAMVRGKEKLTEQVTCIELQPGHAFRYKAGQYTTLTNIDGISADYAIASVHSESGLMRFHVVDNDASPLSHYLIHELEVDDGLEIQTALGNRFYQEDFSSQPLLLIAEDEGLAPALALIDDALEQGHQGEIHLAMINHELDSDYAAGLLERFKQHINIACYSLEQALQSTELTNWLAIIKQLDQARGFIHSKHLHKLSERLQSAGLPSESIASNFPHHY